MAVARQPIAVMITFSKAADAYRSSKKIYPYIMTVNSTGVLISP
jgi:hypothetical protein